jgi:hypothetical protein
MEHLLNCHGEWVAVLQGLALLPFIGVWVKARFGHSHDHKET